MKKTNYQVTIGYKAVIVANVIADNEEQAKSVALERFKKENEKMFKSGHLELQDDSYGAYGIINIDKTWNEL